MLDAAAVAIAIHLALPGIPSTLAQRYGADIAAVAQTREEALLLVTIQRHESSFDPAVERCATLGREGEITAFQLLPGRFTKARRIRLCGSNREAAAEARGRIVEFLAATGTERGALSMYAGKHRDHRRINDRMKTYQMLNLEAPADPE
jgi:hypothetical protein